jgi:hypothetical protein
MRLTTTKTTEKVDAFGFKCNSLDVKNRHAKVTHSQKRTYKGTKIASIQNKTEFIQLGGIDKKDANKKRKLEKRAKKRECYSL